MWGITDSMVSSVGKTLNILDTAIRVILCEVGIWKILNDVNHFFISGKGIEEFKARNKFNGTNIEVALCRFSGKRCFFIRLGEYDLILDSFSSPFKKNNITRAPRILGGFRKAIKFIINVANNYFRTNDLLNVLLEGLESDIE